MWFVTNLNVRSVENQVGQDRALGHGYNSCNDRSWLLIAGHITSLYKYTHMCNLFGDIDYILAIVSVYSPSCMHAVLSMSLIKRNWLTKALFLHWHRQCKNISLGSISLFVLVRHLLVLI